MSVGPFSRCIGTALGEYACDAELVQRCGDLPQHVRGGAHLVEFQTQSALFQAMGLIQAILFCPPSRPWQDVRDEQHERRDGTCG